MKGCILTIWRIFLTAGDVYRWEQSQGGRVYKLRLQSILPGSLLITRSSYPDVTSRVPVADK